MNLVTALYLAFPVLSLALFLRLPARTAVALVYLVGLVWLPPMPYPPGDPAAFPYWIIGSALPSDLLVGKAWIAPLTALAGSLIFSSESWSRLRLRALDMILLAFCLWPSVQSLIVPAASPAGWQSSLYLLGVWAIPWFLGRVHCQDADDIWHLLKILVGVMLSLVPLAIWEGIASPNLYGALFEQHPFYLDGAARYLGYRPIAFFEHGNQYGIWICAAALAAWAIVRNHAGYPSSEKWIVAAVTATIFAFAAQSIGALMLLVGGLILYFSPAVRTGMTRVMLPALIGAVLFGGIYASGIIPIRAWAEQSSIGSAALDMVRSTGRGSFAWRVSQDQRVVPLIAKAPIVGAGRWDWWRPAQTRPWNLPMLILGQFGLIGLALGVTAICGALMQPMIRRTRDKPLRLARRLLSLLVLIALFDALLNSFIFLPAIAMAGALAGRFERKEKRRQSRPQPASASD